jgi:hypothetical protein
LFAYVIDVSSSNDITFSLPPTFHHRRWHFNLLGGGFNDSFRDVHDKSTALVLFVGATALEPPIHRSLVADADTGLGPPTYHPRLLKWWGFIVWDLLFGF